jgi:predicted NAD-dependent protein-ADP-ribosyltransferase YbiA (DUF1768 family)
VGKGCLSQWWPARFTVDDVSYNSAEHYMMAAKARLSGDAEAAGKILAAPHPGAAKALGREVRGFDEQLWDFLAGTGSRVLVEASPRDSVWGIGLAADDERAGSPERWPGLNLLGFALMEVRHQLRAEQVI